MKREKIIDLVLNKDGVYESVSEKKSPDMWRPYQEKQLEELVEKFERTADCVVRIGTVLSRFIKVR